MKERSPGAPSMPWLVASQNDVDSGEAGSIAGGSFLFIAGQQLRFSLKLAVIAKMHVDFAVNSHE